MARGGIDGARGNRWRAWRKADRWRARGGRVGAKSRAISICILSNFSVGLPGRAADPPGIAVPITRPTSLRRAHTTNQLVRAGLAEACRRDGAGGGRAPGAGQPGPLALLVLLSPKGRVGPPTARLEPRQARKGAAVVGKRVWWALSLFVGLHSSRYRCLEVGRSLRIRRVTASWREHLDAGSVVRQRSI